jgi:hypothetical protein
MVRAEREKMNYRTRLSVAALVGLVGSFSSQADAQYCSLGASAQISYYNNSCNASAVLTGVNQSSSPGGNGVYGKTQAGYPYAGIYGTSSASSGQTGVYGKATGTGSAAINGETDVGDGVLGWASGTNGVGVYGVTTGSATWAGYFSGNLKVTGTPHCNGCTAFTNDSDVRLKKNVQPLVGALDRLMQLHGVTFEWKDPAEHGDRTGTQRGFIAQEVEKVIPEWVGTGSNGFKTLNLSGIEPMVVESLRTLKMENEALKDRVKALEDSRRPLRAGLGEGALGFGALVLVAGAFLLSRRTRTRTEI